MHFRIKAICMEVIQVNIYGSAVDISIHTYRFIQEFNLVNI